MEVVSPFVNDKAQRDFLLVRRAREEGDERAFANLVQIYREPIYLMLLKMTNDPTEADDLTIEAFGKAFSSLHLYTPTYAFSTWLFSIAANHGIDYIRKKKMDTVYLDDICTRSNDDVYEYPIPSFDDNPEEEMIRKQRVQILREVVEQMKPRYRQLVELRYFEELAYEEIAERLNLPLGTVKTQLFRARDLLQSILRSKKGVF